MNQVTVIAHPLVQHNLTRLRDVRTGSEEFRRGLGEVASLMVYEATRSFQTRPVSVTTPLAKTRGAQFTPAGVLLLPLDGQSSAADILRFLGERLAELKGKPA